ncbi:hypothetical protein I4U23_021569 [Adineta vaga]|nr:hypothetical protein I4U23_021569 [Adineta vaga]
MCNSTRDNNITDQARLNYEEQNQYKIRVQFFNQTQFIEEAFLIEIQDINESPYNLQCSHQTGFCTAIDDDLNQTLKFHAKTIENYLNETYTEIICTDNGQPPLSISTWIKVLSNELNLIFVPVVPLIIPIMDENTNRDKPTRDNIVISDFNDGDNTERHRRQVNSPPQDIHFNMFDLTVPENARDVDIASVYVIDDENDNYVCNVDTHDAPNDRQPFAIVNGILRTSIFIQNQLYDLDYETMPVYHITVMCTDPIHQFTISKNFSIDISDLNEAPVQLRIEPNTLPENSPIGYVIGRFHTTDPDLSSLNQSFTYSIITDPKHSFQINNDQLILTRTNNVEMCIDQPDLCPHDYEQISSVLIRIHVEDNGIPREGQKFWIQIPITDENDPPIDLQLNQNTVRENSPNGTLIGTFSVKDQDLYQAHTFILLFQSSLIHNEEVFTIEDNSLRLIKSPDYEKEQSYLITVQAIDNGTIPLSVTSDFLIQILDVNELPKTYAFISNLDDIISNNTINDLLNDTKQSVRTIYLSENAYFQSKLGRIVFLMEDRDRDLNLKGSDDSNELSFSKPTCEFLSTISYRSLCTSIVTIENHQSILNDNTSLGYIINTPLILTSNAQTWIFPRNLRIKFENISLTINGQLTESVDILRTNSTGKEIGKLNAIDLVTTENSIESIILNPDRTLSYPLELTDSKMLKIRDDVNLSLPDSPRTFNVSVLIAIRYEDEDENPNIEKYFIVNLKEKSDFFLTLSNNQVAENACENTLIGSLILVDGIGDYAFDLIDNANGRFKLNGTNLFTNQTYIEHCHLNHTCPLDYEIEPNINITVAVRDPSTNEILRQIVYSIQLQDENETPHNLTLSTQSTPENTPVGSVIAFIDVHDDDINQTITYSTTNPMFTIKENQLILNSPLDHSLRENVSVYIRATDNGQPPTFTEKLFLINVTPRNRAPINVTSTPMILYISENSDPIPSIIGQILIIDPDENEIFDIKFDKANFLALIPSTDPYSLILDDGSVVYAQLYNISVVDLHPPLVQSNTSLSTDVTATITDSYNHSITYKFTVEYLPKTSENSTISTTPLLITTTIGSLSQALHIHIYETTPSNTPIVRGVLSTLTINHTSNCTVIDENYNSFPINLTQLSFIISLPMNYTLNSTITPQIFLDVQCIFSNNSTMDQAIVIDVLPTPPPLQINFNQTKSFDATNNITNQTILGQFYLTESINRTFNLELINNEDIFQLTSNYSLIQIGPYPTNIIELDEPNINLTIQAIEITPNLPTRIVQTTFKIPVIVNATIPIITLSATSILYDTSFNITIGNFSVYSIKRPYRLTLLESYDNGLELDSLTNSLILKRPINTFPLKDNNTRLRVTVALVNETNGTILFTTFPLTITHSLRTDLCATKDCGNGSCISLNETSSYCLCTSGYIGLDCRTIDHCAYNPCLNNGICDQLSIENDFSCQCLPNHSGRLCEIYVDVCQLNLSLCSSNDICIPINDNLTNRELCIGYDQAIQLTNYFKSLPDFCPNCTFTEAADKFYWFDKTLPFLPLWLTLILGSFLLAALPFLPLGSNVPKKVELPLMKAKVNLEKEEIENPILLNSVRLAEKSRRERHDSGYESNEEKENYLDQIITNYQQENTFHVYPILHGPRSTSYERRGTTIDDILSSHLTSRSRTNSSSLPQQRVQRSKSMSPHQTNRRSTTTGNSQTLKPIIQRRSEIFESSIGTLISLVGTPRLNRDDDTYVSSTFRSENTSKFVIGTLWNTFALVNNLFLQRPRKRRNALSGNFNIQADELARLQELYSLAEREQESQFSTINLQTILREALSQPNSNRTNHLQAILFDILSTKKVHSCTCYGNRHVPSCLYYDHSLPYLHSSPPRTSNLENIYDSILKSNKPHRQDATTQSNLEKPIRSSTYFKSTNNVSTQSSPIISFKQIHSDKFNVSTQTIENRFLDVSTQFSPNESKPIVDHIYVNISTQEIQPKQQINSKKIIETNQRNNLLNELKDVFSSSTTNESIPNHSVRSLVSIFETTSPNKSNITFPSKISIKTFPTSSQIVSTSNLNLVSEENLDQIEDYANELSSKIVENAVKTTMIHSNEQQTQRRFSSYKNAGEHGKSLLFQSNTFVPSIDNTKQEIDENFQVEGNEPLISLISLPTQHTLIVGRHIDGNHSNRSRRTKHRSLTLDTNNDSSSLSSFDDEQQQQQLDPRQFLSNSQLFSAHELYIRPWLVRRATAPDIHCLDNNINDTYIEANTSSSLQIYFPIFPRHSNCDLYTQYTCLITILLYLRDIHDPYSNGILYEKLDKIEKEFNSPSFSPPTIQSNVFETINPDGSKRYRTGFVLDINSIDSPMTRPKIFTNQIDWKYVKLVTRRFRKKYQHYKQLIKNDEINKSNPSTIDNYLRSFDSISKRRMKKYAKHYAEKI